jgi:hypothetical protein
MHSGISSSNLYADKPGRQERGEAATTVVVSALSCELAMKGSARAFSHPVGVSLTRHLLTVGALLALNIVVLIASHHIQTPTFVLAPQLSQPLHQLDPQPTRIPKVKNDSQSSVPPPPICSEAGAALRLTCGPGSGAFDCLPSVRNAAPLRRRALATFLQNDEYLAAALTLAYTLRKHGNALPLIMFTIEGLGQLSPAARQLVECAGWQIREWKGIKPYKDTHPSFHHQCEVPHLAQTLTLCCCTLYQPCPVFLLCSIAAHFIS